jgi:ATP-dependent helicase/nuclease subunit A
LQRKLNIPSALMPELLQQAQAILSAPGLSRFFDAQYYLQAANEAGYVNAAGQLRRIDRLVEFETEVWVLDYKTGLNSEMQSHTAQLEEYRIAMQAVYPDKTVRCAVIFGDGKLLEV